MGAVVAGAGASSVVPGSVVSGSAAVGAGVAGAVVAGAVSGAGAAPSPLGLLPQAAASMTMAQSTASVRRLLNIAPSRNRAATAALDAGLSGTRRGRRSFAPIMTEMAPARNVGTDVGR